MAWASPTQDLGQYTKAIEHHEQAAAIHRQIGDLRGEGNDFENLSNVYALLGQHDKAAAFQEASKGIADRLKN